MEKFFPELDRDLTGKLGKRKIHIREGGGRLNPVRLCTDQRIFQVKRPGPGATMLLDASRSMALEDTDIFRLLKVARGATVACYCGSHCEGGLWILAHKGRMVSGIPELVQEWGGNTVDGPALDWLVSQPAHPKVWISDQQVIGVDGATIGLLAECLRKVKRGRIRTARDIDEAVKVIRLR